MMNLNEMKYLNLLDEVLEVGIPKVDRTGVGTLSQTEGVSIPLHMSEGFPLVTTKKTRFKSIVGELLWFLSGSTDVKDLHSMDNHIWDQWAGKDGQFGPIYGEQWRHFGRDFQKRTCAGDCGIVSIDQISEVLISIKGNPFSRRHVVTAWNPQDVSQSEPPPCHLMFTLTVDPSLIDKREPGTLNLNFAMRSTDLFIGLPFNIASYALLLSLMAKECDLSPGNLTYTCIGDAHIYSNHVSQVVIQLDREPLPAPSLEVLDTPDLTKMIWSDGSPIELASFGSECNGKVQSYVRGRESDVKVILCNYKHLGALPAPVAK